MCIQNEPGHGYSCFCQPGFVGRNCEYNYNDCLLWPCPDGFTCVDGVNSVSCVAMETNVTSAPAVFLTHAEQAADITYGRYSGTSFLEFEGINLSAVSNITVRFQTRSVNGTLLYVDQGAGFFFIKLYLNNGILKYDFSCSQEEGIHSINTKGRVNDGKEYVVHMRQYLAPCEAEVAVSGFQHAQSNPINYWSEVTLQTTGHVFVGGLPLTYSSYEGAEPLYNYTGCIEIIEINKLRGFYTSNAIAGNNIENCKSSRHQDSLADAVVPSDAFSPPRGAGSINLLPTVPSLACSDEPCLNGGMCHPLSMPGGAAAFFCNCPLHYTGRLCEKDPSETDIVAPEPSFVGGRRSVRVLGGGRRSELLLGGGRRLALLLSCGRHSALLLGCGRRSAPPLSCGRRIGPFGLAVGSFAPPTCLAPASHSPHVPRLDPRSPHVPRLDPRSPHLPRLGPRFPPLALLLLLAPPPPKCLALLLAPPTGLSTFLAPPQDPLLDRTFGGGLGKRSPFLVQFYRQDLMGSSVAQRQIQAIVNVIAQSIAFHFHQYVEVVANEILDTNTLDNHRNIEASSVQGHKKIKEFKVVFGPTFLGSVPFPSKLHGSIDNVSGFVGCIMELQVNSRELHIMEEAHQGQHIHKCDTAKCQHQPCRNGGTCISDAETWFCVCPLLYSGKLCQFNACERNPCAHGATCVPKGPLEPVCLCPHGRQGLLCDKAIKITRPRFSGLDEFGYSSYMAYPPISSMSYFYEFRLKLTFSNNSTAMKNNLILFSGQKGQGTTGDDFFALGVRNRRIIHKFNLGSGVATIVSDPLNLRIKIHTVHFGRYLRNGWMKVDGQRNKTGSSPGNLAALTTFSPLYVGGFSEHIPAMLPLGARFNNSFQDGLQQQKIKSVSISVTQEQESEAGSGNLASCQCGYGWKGALCSERVSFCDLEHVPPPSCARGSTCVPLPEGYSCQCPLGTGGKFCQEALSISDPFFEANQSSWMAFPPVHMRYRTHLLLQFKTISLEGILFYTAQYLSAQAGDFISLSLSGGFVQFRYNLGDTTIVLQSPNRVDLMGSTWHTVKAGREGKQGYLVLDEHSVIRNTSKGMTTLDLSTEVFIGGVSVMNSVSPDAVEKEPTGFSGSIREVIINGHELELTERGALRGVNVKDWDGTQCGYK
ncbi:hypothetical protein QTP86_010304 [Hemibagrus guttatus]|nr:hypothetical protein QTP86_010304 [Hemibagrus guttatus]